MPRRRVPSEQPAIARARGFAAVLGIVFGVVGLSGFLSLVRGVIPWTTGFGLALMVAGGVLGGLVLLTRDVGAARLLGWWAGGSTVLGFAGFHLASILTP